MKILFYTVVFLTLTCRNECLAGNDNYTPYDIKSRTIRPLTASPVITDKGEFRDKILPSRATRQRQSMEQELIYDTIVRQ